MFKRRQSLVSWVLAGLICAALVGCYVGYQQASNNQSGSADAATGEEHEMAFAADETLQITEDALRGDGILFEGAPSGTGLTTLWRNADINTPRPWYSLFVASQPRYRYEINILPEGSQKSRIIVNVRTEGIPDAEIPDYKASNRFALFKEIDELAAKYPPPSNLPSTGGVNFAVLPHEDLKALAKRVTGNEDNWRQIAKDNGLASPTDVAPFQNVWVRNSLLGPSAQR